MFKTITHSKPMKTGQEPNYPPAKNLS